MYLDFKRHIVPQRHTKAEFCTWVNAHLQSVILLERDETLLAAFFVLVTGFFTFSAGGTPCADACGSWDGAASSAGVDLPLLAGKVPRLGLLERSSDLGTKMKQHIVVLISQLHSLEFKIFCILVLATSDGDKKHGYVGLVFRKICLVCVNSLIVLLIQLEQLTAIPAAQELPVLYAVNELYLSIIGDV